MAHLGRLMAPTGLSMQCAAVLNPYFAAQASQRKATVDGEDEAAKTSRGEEPRSGIAALLNPGAAAEEKLAKEEEEVFGKVISSLRLEMEELRGDQVTLRQERDLAPLNQ